MKPLPLARVRRALVLAPHPDDEAIGAWGVIAALRRQGAYVRVVIAADGAASHPNSARWPRRRLVAERRRETRRAMRAIGVAAGAIRFLDLPDGAVASHPAGEVARAIVRARADLILLPAADDDHPDHRAVAVAAARARTPGARRFSYGVWQPRTVRARRPTHGRALGAGQGAKRAAIRRYRTQCGLIRDDPQGFAIAPHELRAFTQPSERFCVLCR